MWARGGTKWVKVKVLWGGRSAKEDDEEKDTRGLAEVNLNVVVSSLTGITSARRLSWVGRWWGDYTVNSKEVCGVTQEKGWGCWGGERERGWGGGV